MKRWAMHIAKKQNKAINRFQANDSNKMNKYLKRSL